MYLWLWHCLELWCVILNFAGSKKWKVVDIFLVPLSATPTSGLLNQDKLKKALQTSAVFNLSPPTFSCPFPALSEMDIHEIKMFHFQSISPTVFLGVHLSILLLVTYLLFFIYWKWFFIAYLGKSIIIYLDMATSWDRFTLLVDLWEEWPNLQKKNNQNNFICMVV